jgi:hypothetical protein
MLRRVRREIALQLVTTLLSLVLVLWAIPSGLAAGALPVPAGNTPLADVIQHLRVKNEEAPA